jgi:putative methyltransferase
MKHNAYLVQVNVQYGANVYLPYSVGLLQAYAQSVKEIADNFQFKEFIFLRDDPGTVARGLDRPAVVGFSCYLWNWEWSKAVARDIRRRHPGCLIVMGGPQVPVRSTNFFHKHPYVDLLVHNEGEIPYAEILLERLLEAPDYTRIEGLSVKVAGNQCHQTPPRARLSNLDVLPSPYLEGTFDKLLRYPYSFAACQETHRGCPYSCTFCDWGSATYTKVRPFGDERLVREFEWFGQNKMEYVFNCDANYGLLQRDLALTKQMAETKRKYGYPKGFRANYAKNSNLKTFEIAKLLNDVDMTKAISLAFQSMDDHVLELIKRKNIKIDNCRELLQLYRREGIPTFTELIMGLPGETYDSFVEGIDRLLEAGQHDGLNVYICSALPNSEMSDPAYIQEHGLEIVTSPISLVHTSPSADQAIEYNDIVVATNTMPRRDFVSTFLYTWAMQCFHCLGLTQYSARFLHAKYGLAYRAFYEGLLYYARANPNTLTGQQLQLVSDIVHAATEGGEWGVVLPRFGNMMWPTEEATFLNLVVEKERVYQELSEFLTRLIADKEFDMAEDLLEDLLTYQRYSVTDPFTPDRLSFDLRYDLHGYFQGNDEGIEQPITRKSSRVTATAEVVFGGNLELYAQEAVWYGRKGRKVRQTVLESVDSPAGRLTYAN